MTESKTTQQQTSFNVLLIGDSCVDEYKVGTIDRLSPEAPVPVIKIVESSSVPGMASNVDRNLQAFNMNVDFITNDEIIVKRRFIDKRSGQHMLRVDEEPAVVPWDGSLPRPLEYYDAIVISDYNKGLLSYEHIEQLIKAPCPVFIDTKKQDLARFHGAYVKINEVEYNNRFSINDKLIITLGGKGAMFKQFNSELMFHVKPVEVTDVCGCGDTFLSALVCQYLYTKDINKAIIFANVAAGITVQHRGNYAPTYDEIRIAGY